MKRIVVAILSALLALTVSAQGITPKRIMALFSASGIADEGLLRDSLEAALSAAPLAEAVIRKEADGEELGASATRHSCQLSLSVDAVRVEGELIIKWRFATAAVGSTDLRTGSFTKAIPSARDLVSSFWTDLVQDLEPSIQEMKALPLDHIVVIAPPGTRIEGFGEAFLIPSTGEVELPVDLPSFVQWKASSPNFFDASGSAFIAEPLERVELPMRRLPAWTAELSLYGLSFPEASASVLIGKRLFARFTLTQFMSGLNLQNYAGPPPAPSLFSSYSLMHAGVGFGSFFENPSNTLRFYAGMDVFLRLAMPGYRIFLVDPVAPVGISPIFGAEWGRDTRSKLFFEIGGIFYPYSLVELMLASQGSSSGRLVFSGTGWFTDWLPGHPGWLAEFPLPRLGLRIYL